MSFIRHDFIIGPVLNEPGISDVEGGRWSRRTIHCRWCDEQRRVWVGVSPSEIHDRCTVGRTRRLVRRWLKR